MKTQQQGIVSMAKNTKFDLDLEYGQIREKRIENLLKGGKIEIKTERSWWRKTVNIAIEYEYRDKPSGIFKTESKWWFHTTIFVHCKSYKCFILSFFSERFITLPN